VSARRAGAVAVAVVASLPASVLATLALRPLWTWLDVQVGVESWGHSGPAGWCFLVTATVLAATAAALALVVTRGPRRPAGGGSPPA